MEEVLRNYDDGQEERDENGELLKPVFSDHDELEWEIYEEKTKKKKENKRKRGKRGRVLEGQAYEEAKEKFPEIAEQIEKLDYQVDMVGDIACKFNYRQTEAETYGLTTDELLNATDAELNQWVSLKTVTRYEDDGFTKNKFWSNPKKVEAKKRKVFKSLYAEPED